MTLRVIDASGYMPPDFEEKDSLLPFEPLADTELEYAFHDAHRNALYDQDGVKIDSPERELLEKAVVQAVLEDRADSIRLWSLLNVSDDTDYIDTLEKKYTVELSLLRITDQIFKLTYLFYGANRLDTKDLENQSNIIEYAVKASELAKSLAEVELVATHLTSTDGNATLIRGSQALLASSGYQDYLGRGVYLGILGSFRNWKQGGASDTDTNKRLFRCKIALKDTLPFICSASRTDDAEAMVNIPVEALDIHAGTDAVAKPEGIWDYDYEQENLADIQEIAPWKIQVLEKILKASARIETVDRYPAVILDTEEPPIVWLSVIKILKIARCFTPESYKQYLLKNKQF
ncbi:MAG: hypothetical protein GW762_01565 [Candidatus Pacebacteria bacterium]|nr:hypothetical protein [Candidatus Paceibacterota bacterium]PIR63369.1 MAG: hypothetical protein COU64_04810 [Candidatus Pacebacteria bacterium CG10_big_fil_rev_8_21_14_0_10_40_26]PIZ79117.1 MAG: hypothetical protein COY01_01680 [Candidatus Pacebacteria bacterium CG_4_10_14_0_2_um_filter_40_20]PJA69195.1 MAG: hypothetical protein CO156_01155 [Candidatus Pacebacteria bacterium CG_4_9_14_3_um_filter_40_12]PJC42083.1 MAG: hypothetical protein CO041_00390 [Candidatus Pacebacteria bacterium CG_4_9_